MNFDKLQELDLLGLMPCPLKVPFEQVCNSYVSFLEGKDEDAHYKCLIESNANKEVNFFAWIAACSNIDELPGIMMAPGFNHFFSRDFMDNFKRQFTAVRGRANNTSLHGVDLADPDGHYNILSFNPTVMLVDRTLHPDLPVPRCWADLLKSEYEDLVALRGHMNENFCEGIIMNIYKEHGEEGVKRLGRAVKMGVHPSQMVKFAGSAKKEAPAVSAVPYSFARLVKANDKVKIVWPEDGAIVNPFVMLVKSSELPRLQKIAEFIAGSPIGQVFASTFFPSYHPEVLNDLPPEARFKWLGWDFIQENDLGELVPKLENILLSSYREKMA